MSTKSTLPLLLDKNAVAKYLGVDPQTVVREYNRGILPGFRTGKKLRFTESDIVKYMEKKRSCQKNSALENTGFAKDLETQTGTSAGGTPSREAIAAHRLAQQTFGKQKSN